jgi:hypothetical protein
MPGQPFDFSSPEWRGIVRDANRAAQSRRLAEAAQSQASAISGSRTLAGQQLAQRANDVSWANRTLRGLPTDGLSRPSWAGNQPQNGPIVRQPRGRATPATPPPSRVSAPRGIPRGGGAIRGAGQVTRVAGRAVGPALAVFDGVQAGRAVARAGGTPAQAITTGSTTAAGTYLGGGGGLYVGAAIGSAILPGAGTLIGGVVGSLVGAMAGSSLGRAAGNALGGLRPDGSTPVDGPGSTAPVVLSQTPQDAPYTGGQGPHFYRVDITVTGTLTNGDTYNRTEGSEVLGPLGGLVFDDIPESTLSRFQVFGASGQASSGAFPDDLQGVQVSVDVARVDGTSRAEDRAVYGDLPTTPGIAPANPRPLPPSEPPPAPLWGGSAAPTAPAPAPTTPQGEPAPAPRPNGAPNPLPPSPRPVPAGEPPPSPAPEPEPATVPAGLGDTAPAPVPSPSNPAPSGGYSRGAIATAGVGLGVGTAISLGVNGQATRIIDPIKKTFAQPPSNKPPTPGPVNTGCRCNAAILSKLNQMQGANAVGEAGSMAAILQKLNAMQAFAEKAWKATQAQKILDVLTFIGVMHNAAFLSREVAETMSYMVGNVLNIFGIEDENGSNLDVFGWLGDTINGFFVKVFGQDLVDDARETWKKASAILRSASMIIWTVRSILDGTQELMEWIADNTGKIGNALKRWGVVGQTAYPWMAENVRSQDRIRRRTRRFIDGLETAEDAASSFAMATGQVVEIQEEISELGEQQQRFNDSVRDFVPGAEPDNSELPVAADEGIANAQAGAEIAPTDFERGTPP